VPESASASSDLDLISYLKPIPDARMRRGVRFPAWYLLLVAVLGILSGCQSMRDLERYAIRHHSDLTKGLGLELRRPPFDSSFRYFFLQVDLAAISAAIRDWTISQVPGAAWSARLAGGMKPSTPRPSRLLFSPAARATQARLGNSAITAG
jgi:hypothetical protein